MKQLRFACLLAAVAAVSSANAATLTFQNGVNGYSGTFDRRISLNTNVNGADVDTTVDPFWIDGDPIDSSRSDVLYRFDNLIGPGAIPAGATILSAQFNLTTTGAAASTNSQSGESYNVYRLTAPFDGTVTLDGTYGDNDGQFTNNVDGIEPEQGEADWIVGTFDHPIGSTRAQDETYSADVTRAVQSWVSGAPNYGIAVLSDHRDNDDGWSVHSTGSPLVAARPSLTVEYTVDPKFSVFELQDGLNGYNGTTDVLLNIVTDDADTPERDDDTVVGGIDASTESEVFLDGDNGETSYDTPYMISFDTSSVDGKVFKAELLIKTGHESGSADAAGSAEYGVHQLLVPFDATSEYGDFAGDRAALLNAGEIGPQVDSFRDIDEAEYVKVDVTDIVRNWQNGDANYGFYIGSTGTTNGWQIFTSGAVDPDLAPMLRVIAVPEPSTIALSIIAGVGLLVARRRS